MNARGRQTVYRFIPMFVAFHYDGFRRVYNRYKLKALKEKNVLFVKKSCSRKAPDAKKIQREVVLSSSKPGWLND